MKSPFPGMDPHLETHWEDVHQRLIVYACDMVQPRLPNDLQARVEERVFVECQTNRVRQVIPDLHVAHAYSPGNLREGEAAVAEPMIFEVHDLPITESYLEIRARGGGKVITVIEFLSLANKSGGAGQQKYLEKQAEVLGSDASLVEIDLVRPGRRVLALPPPEIPPAYQGDYLACISPGWKRNRRELYLMPLGQRLPVLPIPLRESDRPVPLDLQALVDQAYVAGRYHNLDYSSNLDPPLAPEEASWAAALLKQAGKKTRNESGSSAAPPH